MYEQYMRQKKHESVIVRPRESEVTTAKPITLLSVADEFLKYIKMVQVEQH